MLWFCQNRDGNEDGSSDQDAEGTLKKSPYWLHTRPYSRYYRRLKTSVRYLVELRGMFAGPCLPPIESQGTLNTPLISLQWQPLLHCTLAVDYTSPLQTQTGQGKRMVYILSLSMTVRISRGETHSIFAFAISRPGKVEGRSQREQWYTTYLRHSQICRNI